MEFRSAEEVKAEYERIMGEPLGSLFHALWQDVAWVYREWHEYVALFGTKPSRVELLNKTAPIFFRIVGDSLWEATVLHIARLTDPPKSVGKANLTINALSSLISDPQLSMKISELTQKAVLAAEFCRDWRNRHIAHRDLNLALSNGAEPLKPASREKVKIALRRIVEVLNGINLHYIESTIFFDAPDFPGGAMSLLYVLDDGLKMGAEQQDRLKRGEVRGNDFPARDL
ncbi:MAG: hypothetical protein ABSC04_18280 [Syntrophobacteraceae bacterium]|jgi:hypothetical protein